MQPEAERRWVQFLDIAINGHGVSDDFFALHATNHEHTTDFAHSVYEKTGFDGCEEYEFDVQQTPITPRKPSSAVICADD